MDYGTLRGIIAFIILALFIIIVIWSYSKKRKADFDKAANSIFEEDSQTTDHKEEINKQGTKNV
ncbi:cbb3-type cytochrome c oxidase subunit 3 [Thalassotalea sp. G2M2-11]|uniref:cbb3-type cytochrome oxidase subunit 3 n=1 Tax=Thalassotalea sp. G2M2-11 TaxID=2787627 RepID=UPI0019D1644A|nr:cbb3-type cytochrome c oxidase subunit 3 [Thalassotalea sp. G2M2-11]